MVIPVRAEDVMPSEDFTYELATRQWIDMFTDWEKAIEALGRKIDAIIPPTVEPWMVCTAGRRHAVALHAQEGGAARQRALPKAAIGAVAGLALAAIAGGVWLMRPPPPPPPPACPRA